MPPITSPIESPTVAIQGELGSFHDVAANNLQLVRRPRIVPSETFEEVHDLMRTRKVDFGLTALDNTVDGQVQLSMQELIRNDDSFVLEMLRAQIRQYIVGHAAFSDLAELQAAGDSVRIISHPKALGQAKPLLKKLLPLAVTEDRNDTAGALREVVGRQGESDKHGLFYVAVAGKMAIKQYASSGATPILEEPVSPQNNYTTFALLSREPRLNPWATDTAIHIRQHEDHPGSLEEILRHMRRRRFDIRHPFARRRLGLNLSAIDSISEPTTRAQYSFFMNVDTPLTDPDMESAISQLERNGNNVRVIGSYSKSQVDDPEATLLTA